MSDCKNLEEKCFRQREWHMQRSWGRNSRLVWGREGRPMCLEKSEWEGLTVKSDINKSDLQRARE